MIFIPMPPEAPAPTRHSRELGKRMEQAIRDYQRQYPELTDDEIRAALAQSEGTTQGTAQAPRQRRIAAVALAVGMVLAGAFAAFVAARSDGGGGGGGPTTTPVLMIAIVAVAVVGAVFRIAWRR